MEKSTHQPILRANLKRRSLSDVPSHFEHVRSSARLHSTMEVRDRGDCRKAAELQSIIMTVSH